MQREIEDRIRLSSGEPWFLDLFVSPVGPDYLCRIHGGDSHVGAVALAEWRAGRAHTRALTVQGHRETAIARHAAHRMCAATRRTVTCVAGIHFDDISRSDVDDISSRAYGLAREAAGMLRHDRLQAELDAPSGPYLRIASRGEVFGERVAEWSRTPVTAALAAHSAAIDAILTDGFGGEVGLFAPLYLSNACTNDCVYCGFRRSSSYERTRLTVEEAVRQADELSSRGIRAIDLVTGEIAADPFVDYVCEATAAILERTSVSRIHLNLGSLTTDQYLRLRDSGAGGYHLYQETYDPKAYFEVHRDGGKREMASRLEAPWRAAEAGFPYLGLGVLLGLSDLRADLASLASHARLLGDDFPGLDVGFSLPRIQTMEADPSYTPGRAVSDDDFVLAMLFLRLEFPKAHLTLTTRERPEIRDLLLRHGVTRVSAGVSTAPGGYGGEPAGASTTDASARAQFRVSDERSTFEIAAAVREAGLKPTYE